MVWSLGIGLREKSIVNWGLTAGRGWGGGGLFPVSSDQSGPNLEIE